jgi:hypothetical protein
MFRRYGACAVFPVMMLVSGCGSWFASKPYAFPGPAEPSATIRMADQSYTALRVMTMDDAGCYAGYSHVPYSNGFWQAAVIPDKRLVLQYEEQGPVGRCQITFSFTPEQGADYLLKPGSWSEKAPGLIPGFVHDRNYCGIGAVRRKGTEERVEPLQGLNVRFGLKCIRLVEKKPRPPVTEHP